jgi:MSHA pilin protein MshD
MFTTNPRQRGFTLIELIIFIVVVSIALAGILSVMNTVVKSSADPMVRKQTIAIAESLLEEILLKDYCDPDTLNTSVSPSTCGTNAVESGRNTYDDVDDYAGYTSTGIVDMTGAATPGLAQYNISPAVAVDTVALGGLTVKRVTVSVTGPQGAVVSLTGYRSKDQ